MRQTKFFCHSGSIFVLLAPLNDPGNQYFKKMPDDIILLQMRAINEDHMIHDSWNIRCDRQNFYHIGPFFALSPTWQPRKSKFWKNQKTTGDIIILTHKHHIWKSYGWSLRYGARLTKCFVIWDCFCPFTPLMTQKFKILKNWKKEKQKQKPGDIIILQMCTINDNDMMYGS